MAALLVAWQGVRRRPLRSALTSVSLFVGVLAIVLIQGGGDFMAQEVVRDSILESGPGVTVQVAVKGDGPDAVATAQQVRDVVRRAAGPTTRTTLVVEQPQFMIGTTGQTGGELAVSVVEPDLIAIKPFPLIRGSWFGSPRLAPQVVLNRAGWGAQGWPAGPASMAFGDGYQRVAVVVVGVVHDGSSQPHAYVDLSGNAYWQRLAYESGSAGVLVSGGVVDPDGLRRRVVELSEPTGLTPRIGDVTRVDRLDSFAGQLAILRRIFLGIAALSLMVGCLGILNIGLATARERADELSLRRALGASLKDVLLIMLLESQVVALLGSLAATLGAILLLPTVVGAFQADSSLGGVKVSAAAVLIGVSASSVAALLGGLYPAVRAARTPIARIIRL
ncbi:ABC transporter permease [Streptomyces sp. SID13031]|uniref:ABC transporter permease n=1 Tax=Streptomyces sp. SID13031 TaxID=2706046 RepID=UPI0013C5A9BA|nr:ABC transporter permease [Streptomyces sp. SID13031]NEA35146.1 ABC transporter permease [Streptomyces sp. SID13031]